MKNALRYYYGLEVDDFEFRDSHYIFDSYALIQITRDLDTSIYQLLVQYQYPVYQIIYNYQGEYITEIDQKKYVLLKIHPISVIWFSTLEQFYIPIGEEGVLPWHQMWMDKVDFYEKLVSTVTSTKLKESFFYYVGLTENAISFYQMIKKDAPLYVAHNRMSQDFDYWNPLNFQIDYRARDIAEYTKKLFFEGRLQIRDLNTYFYRVQFHEQDYLFFYARMLFPSYYFDCFDQIVTGSSEECLDIYLSHCRDYERLLCELYTMFSSFMILPRIDWLFTS